MRHSGFAAIAFAALPHATEGQGFRVAPVAQPEIRVGVVAADAPTALAGLVVNIPAGYYVRIATSVDAGRELHSGGGPALRAEVAARFMTDPFHQSRWGLYGGGGLVGDWREGTRGRGAILIVAGAEFPGRDGWRPAVEAAGGAGLRIGVAVKPVRRTGR